MSAKIIAMTGSLRADSWNTKLARIAAEVARSAGADVTFVELRDFPMPLYNQEIEDSSGLPEHAQRLKDLFKTNHGLLLSSPEYNSSITGALKNAIDWISRPQPDEPPLAAFDGKVVGLMSASPGALGGLRGLVTVRSILGNIKCLVLPDQFALSKAHEAFDDSGALTNENARKQVTAIANKVVRTCDALA
ncbi:MAG: NAD(P)H-dependent oxidoreductase [Phycisphaerales bacterium]|nr:NAD(P)H-dependent oxidoreductase [Phycisphaerales bacterium]